MPLLCLLPSLPLSLPLSLLLLHPSCRRPHRAPKAVVKEHPVSRKRMTRMGRWKGRGTAEEGEGRGRADVRRHRDTGEQGGARRSTEMSSPYRVDVAGGGGGGPAWASAASFRRDGGRSSPVSSPDWVDIDGDARSCWWGRTQKAGPASGEGSVDFYVLAWAVRVEAKQAVASAWAGKRGLEVFAGISGQLRRRLNSLVRCGSWAGCPYP
ncbi:hypothetical protein B0H14DRAFT_2636832 [Mycena olivaceomarginata]|nr:hypothetical protein B0H14DRAFT_2636832 [Mycena olivaceomarginata]